MKKEEAIEFLNTDDYESKGYNDAIEMAIKALEQESLDRDCKHCSKTYGTLGCCTTVDNEWVYSCKEGQKEYLLDKIRAEIDTQEKWLSQAGYNAYNADIAFDAIKHMIEREEKE